MKTNAETITIPITEYNAMKSENAELTQKVNWLMEQFRLAKHRKFGPTSEKSEYDFSQMTIFNEAEFFADPEEKEPELAEVKAHFRKRTRLTTDKLPKDLPVEIVEHELPEAERVCSECGGELHVMGRDTRSEIVIIPAQVKLREHVRHVYSCRHCEQNNDHTPVIKAEMPEPVIKSSFASPEAIAHIATQKFVMGVPLYRQEQDWNRNGILLSRQTMSNWLIKAAEDWLEPIYNAMREKLVTGEVLHADETTLQVLHEPGKPPQSKSYMWLYRTSGDAEQPIVLYEYQPDRKASRPKEFLKDFKGYLHTDGYEAYHTLHEDIKVVGCWAHVRRKFDEALKAVPENVREGSLALAGKRYCDKLFNIDRGFSRLSNDERCDKRQKLAKPLAEEFFAWAEACNAAPKTTTGTAVHYALSQKKYLLRYLEDGRLEISNNRAERSIKPFVIDRKNFLFANTPRGAKASAIIFSIIETAKENDINPFAYLTYIFMNAPNWDIPNNSDALRFLLPDAAKLELV